MKNFIIFILTCALVYLFLFKKEIKPGIIVKTDTVYQTKTLTTYKKGEQIKVRIIERDTLTKTYTLTKTDTAYIVKDYNQVREYKDSIKQDSNLYVITDTISQNRIIGRSFEAQIQEKIITNTIRENKALLYLGIRSDLRQDMGKVEHNISLHLKTRQKGLFSVGYGMSGYSIGYSLKL